MQNESKQNYVIIQQKPKLINIRYKYELKASKINKKELNVKICYVVKENTYLNKAGHCAKKFISTNINFISILRRKD